MKCLLQSTYSSNSWIVEKILTTKMFALHIFNALLLMSPIHSFRFNSFRYLMQKMSSTVTLADPSKYQYWLEQKLDHFDEVENRTWRMRYFKRKDLWKPTGPIYIFLGGEGEASPKPLFCGLAFELANETNGALYATEHRYYGKSVPLYINATKDFKYLSAKQALADIAHLIRIIKLNPVFRKSKVVVIGGSYAGNLAAWMRLLYPDLVDAAVASSAPVLAKKDFYEYLEKVSDDYERYGTKGCWNAINDRFKRYDSLFKTKEGIEKLKEDENICREIDLSIPENKVIFFMIKVGSFQEITQYHNTKSIKKHCVNFNTIKEVLQLSPCLFWVEPKRCYDYGFIKMTEVANQFESHGLGLSWIYQTCTEFGYFQSTSSDRQPFTNNIPVDHYVKMCIRTFGPEYNNTRIEKSINDVNKMYGGLKPNVTNVVFVNGDLDPWSRLGILEDLSYDAPAIVIPQSSHCKDLYESLDSDNEELKEARKSIKYWINKWVNAGDFLNT